VRNTASVSTSQGQWEASSTQSFGPLQKTNLASMPGKRLQKSIACRGLPAVAIRFAFLPSCVEKVIVGMSTHTR
jgi:hypothetical protein